ncbi:UNVERIFIED_CONTAM: hypothetical protein K2H54_035569 [Gekko kuhli]
MLLLEIMGSIQTTMGTSPTCEEIIIGHNQVLFPPSIDTCRYHNRILWGMSSLCNQGMKSWSQEISEQSRNTTLEFMCPDQVDRLDCMGTGLPIPLHRLWSRQMRTDLVWGRGELPGEDIWESFCEQTLYLRQAGSSPM